MTEAADCERGHQLRDQPFAEQFVVWAIRSWVEGLKTGEARSFALQRGFDIAGIPDGMNALDGLFRTLATGAARSIDIRCVRCRQISGDERTILAAIAACQRGQSPAARAVLDCLLVPAAGRIAAIQAIGLAEALSRAKLFLRDSTIVVPLDVHRHDMQGPGAGSGMRTMH